MDKRSVVDSRGFAIARKTRLMVPSDTQCRAFAIAHRRDLCGSCGRKF